VCGKMKRISFSVTCFPYKALQMKHCPHVSIIKQGINYYNTHDRTVRLSEMIGNTAEVN
jgi:hypothetical protein